MPLIEGLDGSAKMSKSLGNAIGITDEPADMYGKTMSLRDELIVKYLRLVTDLGPDEVDDLAAQLADGRLGPRDAKRRLARELVALYHSPAAAAAAEQRFDVQFRDRGIPDDVPVVDLTQDRWFLPTLLQTAGLVSSGSEARRMVSQGAVRLDGEVLTDPTVELEAKDLDGRVVQVGKRRFARLKAAS
jgi:tyrosyl-tRNA synthetase